MTVNDSKCNFLSTDGYRSNYRNSYQLSFDNEHLQSDKLGQCLYPMKAMFSLRGLAETLVSVLVLTYKHKH